MRFTFVAVTRLQPQSGRGDRAPGGAVRAWTFEPPLELELTLTNSGMAHALASVPNATRLDTRVVGFRTDSYLELYVTLLTFEQLSHQTSDPLA